LNVSSLRAEHEGIIGFIGREFPRQTVFGGLFGAAPGAFSPSNKFWRGIPSLTRRRKPANGILAGFLFMLFFMHVHNRPQNYAMKKAAICGCFFQCFVM